MDGYGFGGAYGGYGGAYGGYGVGCGGGYGNWYTLLLNEINDNVLVVLTSGGAYSAVAGILTRVYPEYITLINGNIVVEIPMARIAAVTKLAGGGPVAPAPGTVGGFPAF